MSYSITEATVAWLASLGHAASTYPPKSPPDEFVTVERVGGGVVDMVDRPQLAVQAWALTEARAEEIATDLRMLVLTGSKPAGVHHIAVDSGPYPFWDEDTGRPRYQLVLDCTATI